MEIPTQPARALNPDAGHYRVMAEPRSLDACRAATVRSFRDYPYWLARYPARAAAFSHSDSAWLINVSTEGAEFCADQAAWLGTVLAARGMPRRLLEDHLGRLAEALAEFRPDVPEWGDALRAAAAGLRKYREARIDAATTDRLADGFEQLVAHDPTAVPGCGAVIVAAVCDDAEVPTAVGSLLEWLGDPERFSPAWLAAVEQTLNAAFAACAEPA